MPTFDPVTALRLITNNRLRTAQGWATYRDLGGALAVTSDAPIAALNSLGDFSTTEARLGGLLDIGFALLRAFDRPPAVELSPLDRPAGIAAELERRGLRVESSRAWMTFGGDVDAIATNPDVSVRVADADDVLVFGNLHGGSEPWVRRLSKTSTLSAMLDPGNTFYLGVVDGQPVATLHLLADGATAGIYAVGTMRSFRKRGVASALIARAVRDARNAGCDVIGLSTEFGGTAERLYERLGFTRAFESHLWVEPERPVELVKIRKRRFRTPRT